MSSDRVLRQEIERWVEKAAPPAPWLEHRVIAALSARAGTSDRSGEWFKARWAAPAIAALVIAALVVAVLVGSRVGGRVGQVAPSRDPALVSYRTLIDADMRTVDLTFTTSVACKTRDACARDLAQTRIATETLVRDISASQTPAPLLGAVGLVQTTARQFIAQLDVALAVVQEPNSDYIAATGAPSVYDLDMAVAAVDCWPATPKDGHYGVSCS